MKRYKLLFECEKENINTIEEESKARTVDGYLSPEPGNLPEAGAKMLANIYAARRKAGDDKEKAAKIAWSAVRQKYPKE